jgi:MoaA/NifB/PqqE/SkfB family radical SAM enzyme
MVKKHPSLEKYLLRAEPSRKINIDSIRGSFKNAKLVLFTGGEPMLNEDILEIISIIKQESTELVSVSLTTNMTIINNDILDALNDLGISISISISIDGTPLTNDYIRYGCNWQTMIDNFTYICEKYPRFRYSVNTTVSSLTAGYITDILDIVRNLEIRLGIKFEYLMASPVTDKRFLNPGLLPQSIKDIYLKKLQQYSHESTIPGDYRLIETTREMLNSNGSTEDLYNFIDYIKQVDAVANTNVLDSYPEFKELF